MPTAPFDARTTLDVVEREQVTGLFLVPAQWQVLCADPTSTDRCRSLKTISWGAAPATVSLLQDMAKTFPYAEIISVFGQTEMSPVTTALPSEEAVRKIGSVGKPIPTIVARVVDENMNDVRPGEVGEIVYRGPTLMAGYWHDPEATAAAFEGGWFHSGDLVRADEEGFLYVVDRKKDMIISGGENIYCAEVENVLAAHPAVLDVAVIGAKHARWGETPVAVVVPADPASPPTLEDLVDFSRDKLASYKTPTILVVLNELPRNAAGKVVKHELRARYGEASCGIPLDDVARHSVCHPSSYARGVDEDSAPEACSRRLAAAGGAAPILETPRRDSHAPPGPARSARPGSRGRRGRRAGPRHRRP